MRYIFKTVPLSAYDWIIIVVITFPIIIMEEMRKAIASSFAKASEDKRAH
jgi:hypothetical protein